MLCAQITDLHIKPRGRLAYRQIDTALCLEAVVGHLRAQQPQPDFILATGDLADAGTPEEYGLLREILAPLGLPLFLMPGNHDNRVALRAAFPDHRYLGSDGPIHYAIEDFPVRVLALDSVIEGQSGGRIGAAQLDWLDRQLATWPARPTIVAHHHPPFATGLAQMDRIGLEDTAGLAAVVRRYPQVERILSGHTHRPIQTRFAGTLASTAPSTAHQVALDFCPDAADMFCLEPPSYQLHWYRPDAGLVSHTALIGDWSGPFPFFENGRLID